MSEGVGIMKRQVRVVGIQLFCNGTKEYMRNKVDEYLHKAFEVCTQLDLVVLPEQFYQMECYHFNDEYYGESEHGEFESWICNLAQKYHINIVAGSYPVIGPNKKIYNRCLVIDRKGNLVGKYDKIHLFDAFGIKESDTFEAGADLGLFDLDIGKIGLWICYDTRFPEVARALVNHGAEILCVPAAFYRPNADQWEIMIKSAAIYNVTPVVAVNQYGTLPTGRGFFGRSMIVDPKGVITAGISDKEGYLIGSIDLDYTKQCQNENPQLNNQRRNLYKNWL